MDEEKGIHGKKHGKKSRAYPQEGYYEAAGPTNAWYKPVHHRQRGDIEGHGGRVKSSLRKSNAESVHKQNKPNTPHQKTILSARRGAGAAPRTTQVRKNGQRNFQGDCRPKRYTMLNFRPLEGRWKERAHHHRRPMRGSRLMLELPSEGARPQHRKKEHQR